MTSEMADLLLAETGEKMHKVVVHSRADFSSIRTGRAAPALVEKIPVDYSEQRRNLDPPDIPAAHSGAS
jgi:ribosome recycling factor